MYEDTWQLQEAKAKFSEVVSASQHNPQTITVRGEEKAVLLSKKLFVNLQQRALRGGIKQNNPGSFGAYLAKTPLCNANLQVKRDASPIRGSE